MKKSNAPHGEGIAQPEITSQLNFAELIPVIPGQIGGRETNIVSAKSLHKALGIGNDFSTWVKLRIDEYGFTQGTDYVVFDSSDFRNQSAENNQSGGGWVTKRGGDRRSKDYGLSLGMAKEVAMVERNEQGRAVSFQLAPSTRHLVWGIKHPGSVAANTVALTYGNTRGVRADLAAEVCP
jgi:phage anti-repressor protein